MRRPAIRAPADGRTDWFTGGADRASRVLAGRCDAASAESELWNNCHSATTSPSLPCRCRRGRCDGGRPRPITATSPSSERSKPALAGTERVLNPVIVTSPSSRGTSQSWEPRTVISRLTPRCGRSARAAAARSKAVTSVPVSTSALKPRLAVPASDPQEAESRLGPWLQEPPEGESSARGRSQRARDDRHRHQLHRRLAGLQDR